MDIKNFPKITVILRGYDYENVRTIVDAMVGTEINSVEITMNSTDSFSTIERISKEYRDEILIGAGTVITYEQAKKSIESGARFLLSPIVFSQKVINLCKDKDVVSVAGAFTPSEIHHQLQIGADIVKVFPASIVGPKFFKDIKSPLGEIPLMAVGGINIKNALEYLDNGANFLGIGSGMFNKEDIKNKNTEGIKACIKNFEELLRRQ